jgi:hypothetical protein
MTALGVMGVGSLTNCGESAASVLRWVVHGALVCCLSLAVSSNIVSASEQHSCAVSRNSS